MEGLLMTDNYNKKGLFKVSCVLSLSLSKLNNVQVSLKYFRTSQTSLALSML